VAIAEPVEAPPTSLLEQQYDCFEWMNTDPSAAISAKIGLLHSVSTL
jgi:hypothetical protein